MPESVTVSIIQSIPLMQLVFKMQRDKIIQYNLKYKKCKYNYVPATPIFFFVLHFWLRAINLFNPKISGCHSLQLFQLYSSKPDKLSLTALFIFW